MAIIRATGFIVIPMDEGTDTVIDNKEKRIENSG